MMQDRNVLQGNKLSREDIRLLEWLARILRNGIRCSGSANFVISKDGIRIC